MKQEPNKKLIGLFLIIGIAAFCFIIGKTVWNKYSEAKDDIFVMYFEESLQGLNEGAPVVLQGVEIGKVSRIKLVANNKSDQHFSAPVYAHFKPTAISNYKTYSGTSKNKQDLLKELINQGLRARLVVQSYLTGQLMIELVMLPYTIEKTQPNDENILQIPTVLSKSGVIEKGLDSIKFQEIANRISDVWSIFEKELPILLPALSASSKNLDKTLSQIAAKSGETINNMNRTMQDISDAARSLQNLTDYLERHPESLLTGKKEERR